MAQITDRYVISLTGSPRRELFFSQPQAVAFRAWDAVDGRTGGGRDRFDVEGFRTRYDRDPEGGEIGCALSHADVVAHFAAQPGRGDDLMLVAEDDAVFSEEADAVITRIAAAGVSGWALLAQPAEDPRDHPFWSKSRDIAHLSLLARPVGPRPRPWAYRLGHAEGDFYGAGLYLVSRSAAQLLTTRASKGISWVADDYMGWHAAAGVQVQVLRPTIAGWSGGSEINPETRPHLDMGSYHAHPLGRQAWARRAARFYRGGLVALHDITKRAAGR